MARNGRHNWAALVTIGALIWPACTDQTLDLLAGGGAGAPPSGSGSGGALPSGGNAAAGASASAGSGYAWEGGAGNWEPGMPCFGSDECDSDEYCDPFSRDCVRICETSAYCPDYRPICDLETGPMGHCVECIEDVDCDPEAPREPYCAFVTGRCEECLVDTHCSEPEPFCHPADFRCRECVVSSQCDGDQVCDPDRYECVRGDG